MKKDYEGARPGEATPKRSAEPETSNHESPGPICILAQSAAVRQIQDMAAGGGTG